MGWSVTVRVAASRSVTSVSGWQLRRGPAGVRTRASSRVVQDAGIPGTGPPQEVAVRWG